MTLSAISLTTLSSVPLASAGPDQARFFFWFAHPFWHATANHPQKITPRPTPRPCLPSANGSGARLAAPPLRRPRQPNFHSAC